MLAARLFAAGLGVGLSPVALTMLLAPRQWYAAFPGVSLSGPLNVHFVRDLGCAFLVAAGCYVAAAMRPTKALGVAGAATAFLTLHAGVHLAELIGDPRHRAGSFAASLAVYAPPILGVLCMLIVRRAQAVREIGRCAS